jgi:hypothetical protein
MPRDLSLLMVLLCAFAAPASAANIHIAAKTYFTSGQIPSCGDDIERVSCDGATDTLAVEGVDCGGEWIEFRLTIPSDFCFHPGVRSARYEGLVSHFKIEFHADDADQALVAADSLVTAPGQGAT